MSKSKQNVLPTIADIEKQVWDLEGVRIVIRIPPYLASAKWNGQGYTYQRALNRKTARLAHLHERLSKGVFGHPVSFVAVDGNGQAYPLNDGIGYSQTLLSRIRGTYKVA